MRLLPKRKREAADTSSVAATQKVGKAFGFRQRWAAAFLESPQAILAAILLLLIVGFSLSAPFWGIEPDALNLDNMSQAPSTEHWFGTDGLGRDYFIRVLYGGRVSLAVGLLATLTGTGIGVVVGLAAGFSVPWVDSLLMRIVDFFNSLPWLLMVMVVSLLLQPGIVSIVICVGGFSWMGVARLVRAETLSIRERSYVRYAVYIGQTKIRSAAWHVLPDALPTILVAASAAVSGAMMSEATLSFLGRGIQPPQASWGQLLQIAQGSLQQLPHLALIPGALIMLTIYCLNVLTNVTRKATEAGQ
ncbi:MAG: ABC transporter permease [Propionibacteriaceae bacterium]|jgi:peptide/nickel transport system permease protein|nr:ABC transporter permease [Propionibacteriaceae bacterium]